MRHHHQPPAPPSYLQLSPLPLLAMVLVLVVLVLGAAGATGCMSHTNFWNHHHLPPAVGAFLYLKSAFGMVAATDNGDKLREHRKRLLHGSPTADAHAGDVGSIQEGIAAPTPGSDLSYFSNK